MEWTSYIAAFGPKVSIPRQILGNLLLLDDFFAEDHLKILKQVFYLPMCSGWSQVSPKKSTSSTHAVIFIEIAIYATSFFLHMCSGWSLVSPKKSTITNHAVIFIEIAIYAKSFFTCILDGF